MNIRTLRNYMLHALLVRLLLGWFGLGVAVHAADAVPFDKGSQSKRPVTVEDTITMTQIGDRTYLDAYTRTGNVVQFSPDGSKFAFVIQKGNLRTDTVEFSLLVFNTADAFKSPHPKIVATLASSSSREAISRVKWLRDNDTLFFLGEHPGEPTQIYRVSATTKIVQKLTDQPTPVFAYSVSDQGDAFVYLAGRKRGPVVSEEMRRRGFAVTSQKWTELYTNRHETSDFQYDLFVKNARMAGPQNLGGVLDLYPGKDFTNLKISPNGRYALFNAYVSTPPALWNEYNPRSMLSSITACAAGTTVLCPQQEMLVDLEKLTVQPLIDAPVMLIHQASSPFVWTSENSVLLLNASLPLAHVQGDEFERRRHSLYVLEVLLPSREIVTIAERQAPLETYYLRSDPENNIFVTDSKPAFQFHKQGGVWKITQVSSSGAAFADRLSVTLDQDINSPPKLVAHDPATRRNAVVFDLNPDFSQLTFGKVEIFRWKMRDGRIGAGDLYYPPNYVAGKKYPLVIQTHGYTLDRFWIDGPFTTAFAAQPLANRGFIVLQMDTGDPHDKASLDEWIKTLDTAQEGPYATAFYESAIDELDRRGLIDRSRIGLTGFSRTAYFSLYMLTHSSYPIQAAVIADGVNFGYVDCVFYLAAWAPGSPCEKMNGGLPYGPSLMSWSASAPTFRLDKIEGAVLLQAISGPLGEWEIYAGLQWLKKPTEMLNFYPEGTHVLVRPQQRLLSQGSVIDWYCFWLKGEEDPSPTKTAQYGRWRKLRAEEQGKAAQAAR